MGCILGFISVFAGEATAIATGLRQLQLQWPR
jgi:hypothetical protein